MDMCSYLCGEESVWTREELDEFRGALDDALEADDIHITALYLKQVGNRDAFDVEYHALVDGLDFYSTLMQTVTISPSLAPSVERLVATYVPKVSEILRQEVRNNLRGNTYR